MRFGPPQISQLPVSIPNQETIRDISKSVHQLQKRLDEVGDMDKKALELDNKINETILRMYGIQEDEFTKIINDNFLS